MSSTNRRVRFGIPVVLSLLLAPALTFCDGDGAEGDRTPPTVISTTPTTGATTHSARQAIRSSGRRTWIGWRKPPKMVGVPVMLARAPVTFGSSRRTSVWMSACDLSRSAFGTSRHQFAKTIHFWLFQRIVRVTNQERSVFAEHERKQRTRFAPSFRHAVSFQSLRRFAQ